MLRFTCLLLLLVTKCFSQDSLCIQRYIDQYKAAAIAEEQRTGVPAAITIAQGIHESAAGTSPLVIASNNHFGIKCKTGWTGAAVYHDDDAKGECFRSYTCPQDSYKDHSDFLRANKRYAFLFDYDPLDYESWARGLKQAGYATNPRYPQILITTIERFHLNDLTLVALDKTNTLGNDVAVITTSAAAVASTTQPAATTIFVMDTSATVAAQPVRHIPNAAFDITNTYPTGVFSINGSKVVFAERGTSLLALATMHHVSLGSLLQWNDMKNADILDENQLVFIEKKPKKCSNAYHEVKRGETLWQISQQEGIRLASLMQYNQLTEMATLQEGSKLVLN
jgi:LysM repeat protein